MKKLLLVILALCLIFTTGCWDMIEIDQRIFPYSAGIDLNDEKDGEDEFIVSFSYPNIYALGKNARSNELTFMVSTGADSIFEATHNLSDRMQQPIYLKHLKVLIISEEVANNPQLMKNIIDGINRDYIINKMTNLLIVKDKAKGLIETKVAATRQEDVEGLLYTILRNNQSSTKFTPKAITTFIEDMDVASASIVPLGIPLKKEIKIAGGGVFKNYRFIGYIDERENKDIAMLCGNIHDDGIDIEYEGTNLSLLMTKLKCKKTLEDSEDNLKILYTMKIEGQIQGYTLTNDELDGSDGVIESMEKVMGKKIKEDLKTTIKKLQKELNADVIGVSEYLYKFHPKIWKEIKEDWDYIFPNIDIDVDINMNIRRRGLVR